MLNNRFDSLIISRICAKPSIFLVNYTILLKVLYFVIPFQRSFPLTPRHDLHNYPENHISQQSRKLANFNIKACKGMNYAIIRIGECTSKMYILHKGVHKMALTSSYFHLPDSQD